MAWFLIFFVSALIAQDTPSNKGAAPSANVSADSHRADGGSGIEINSLNPTQVRNLATLGRVWGFLKYYHPRVTAGKFQWDSELFRILPGVLGAPDERSANAEMSKWIVRLGSIGACSMCAQLKESDLQLRPDVGWIKDRAVLGNELSAQLGSIYENRRADGQQFYVELAAEAHNAVLKNEEQYKDIKFPDAGYQLLAAYRFWNAAEYWSPDRDVSGEDWPRVLAESVAKIALAKSKDEYQLQMMAMVARLHDGHANLLSSLAVRPPVGECRLPVRIRFLQHAAVIYALDDEAKEQQFHVGDVVTALDGVSVAKLAEEWKPYYGASNDAGRLAETARYLTRGPCGNATVDVLRGEERLSIKSARTVSTKTIPVNAHDLPGDTFRMLSPEVAYLKLSQAKADDAVHYVESAVDAKGLIIDIRGYPADFMAFDLGSHLVSNVTPFARPTEADLTTPGAFHWGEAVSIEPKFPLFRGKVVVLVDEAAMSSAEFQAMAFRAVPGAVVVGSTTAGADGNVSIIRLPGGLFTLMSGIGVFYPDKRPTQRVGIEPDVVIVPTIKGIREGRDEVLEEGMRQIQGQR